MKLGVHEELKETPFCEINQQITKITSCCEGHREYLCCLCLKNGKEHLIERWRNKATHPLFFIKYLPTNGCGSVYLSPKMCELIAEVNAFVNTEKARGIDVQCEIEMH